MLGTTFEGGEWTREESIQFLTGQQAWPQNDTNRWALFRNPLPPASENAVFRDIRNDAELESNEVLGPRFDELGPDVRGDFLQEFDTLAVRHNPIVRRVVRRTRPMLEGRGLLKPIGVISHPRADDGLSPTLFNGDGLIMSFAFTAAYEAAEAFSRLYAARRPGAGFLKTILLRRIGSSARAGLETARHLLNRIALIFRSCLKTRWATRDCPPMTRLPIRGRCNFFAILSEISRLLWTDRILTRKCR